MEVTPPPTESLSIPCPPHSALRQRRQSVSQAVSQAAATQTAAQQRSCNGRRQFRQRSAGSATAAAAGRQRGSAASGGSGRRQRRQRNGNGNGGRHCNALQGGKNARKHASRINTQTQAQTPLKTLYTASAVQFTQAENRHTKKRSLCTITTQKTQNCRQTTQKRKTVYKNERKNACKRLALGVL